MHRRGMMGCAGVVVCFLVLAAGISAENKQDITIQIPTNWAGVIPWISKNEFKKYITVQLIKKEWKPNLTKIAKNNENSDKYLGSIEDALNTFWDPENHIDSKDVPLDNFIELLKGNYGYDKQKESIFITRIADKKHHWAENVILAMAMRNILTDYNIFLFAIHDIKETVYSGFLQAAIGWEDGTFAALGNTFGEYLDTAIEQQLIRPNRIHLLGFCWAGITSGYIAQHIRRKHKEKVKSVLALDPFSFGVSSIKHNVLLADDAEVVQVHHANALGFGTFTRKANVDIVFNDGLLQPGCSVIEMKCSHERAVKILWFVILYPDLFVARKCDSWSDFYYCRCDGEDTMAITYPPKRPEPTKGGIFFLKTTSEKPYGLGVRGANGCEEKNNGNLQLE